MPETLTESEKPVTENVLETWAVVEVMGHQRYAGFVRTVALGGSAMLRVDVPECPAKEDKFQGYDDAGKLIWKKRILPGCPAFTKFLGIQSIFALTPCSKEAAIAAVHSWRQAPLTVLDIPGHAQRLLNYDGADDDGADDD